jgi:hypothetical protein
VNKKYSYRMQFAIKFTLAITAVLAAVGASPVLNGQNINSCSNQGAMSCYGQGTNGFITCANGQNVYRDCGPGTTCYPLNGGVYCDYPIIPAGTTPSNGSPVGACSVNGAMSCFGSGTNGFVTCVNGLNVYRNCAPGTTCATTNSVVFCGSP